MTAPGVTVAGSLALRIDSRADSYAPARVALSALAAYLGLTLLPLATATAHGASPMVLAAHLVALLGAWQAARVLGRGGRWKQMLAWLPVLAIPVLYRELPLLMLGAGSIFRDAEVQWVERVLFGASPAATMAPAMANVLGAMPSLVLSELLHLGYLSFYCIIYAPLVILILRNEPRMFATALTGLTLVFLLGFVAFILAPVQGPRYLWPAPPSVPDGPVRRLALRVLEAGSSRGTAFPSLHVAISVTQSSLALHWDRSLGLALSVLTVLLAVGAVYGGYHYAVDIIAGAVLGLAAGTMLRRWSRTDAARHPHRTPHAP